MTDRRHVLVVDDEPAFREGLRVALEAEGFAVTVAEDGETALTRFAERAPDLVLLDVMLPRMSGIDVCRRLRETSSVPIIMVSAKGEEIDTVVGLEVGADDYVSKPYRVRELIARMRTVMRRAAPRPEATGSAAEGTGRAQAGGGRMEVGGIALDRDRHEVTVRGERVDLPLKEFEVLALLMEHAGLVVTRQSLIDHVWGYDHVGDTKTVDVHIKRVRAKVEVDPSKPTRIQTVRGVGYKFTNPR